MHPHQDGIYNISVYRSTEHDENLCTPPSYNQVLIIFTVERFALNNRQQFFSDNKQKQENEQILLNT